MIDFFTYNGRNILPEYLPGIPSYGQEGAPGNTGETASSMYYSAYCLSNPKELEEANDKVKTNSLLSNNPDYTSPSYATYKEGDLILDSEGKFYILKDVDGGLKISNVYGTGDDETISSKKPVFKDFKVKCVTSLTKSASSLKYNVVNPLYDKSKDNFYNNSSRYYKTSPFVYHTGQYKIYMYGNHVYFYAMPNNTSSTYSYKFCLCLPNGETLSVHSDTNSATMFVDNRFIFACDKFYDYCISLPDEEEAKFIRIPEGEPGKSVKVKDLIEIGNGWTTTEIETNEAKFLITLLASYFIEENCTAYFEATDTATAKTYRVDLDDIFYTSNNSKIPSTKLPDQDDILGREDYVRPATVNIGWDVINLTKELYLSEGMTLASEYLEKAPSSQNITNNLFFCVDNNESYNFNQFNEFAFVEQYNGNISGVNSLSPNTAEDGRTFLGYFLKNDPNVSQRYYVGGNQYDYKGVLQASNIKEKLQEGAQNLSSEYTLLGNYKGCSTSDQNLGVDGGCPNKILRLYFRKLNELVISVTYNALDDRTYPDTVVYIGRPNMHLFYCDENNADQNGPLAPGIYYLNRIIPYKYSDTLSDEYTTKINGDKATVTIDVSAYKSIENPSQINFIEIGLMSIKDSANRHRTGDLPDDASGRVALEYYDVSICVTNISSENDMSNEYDLESQQREDALKPEQENENSGNASSDDNNSSENSDPFDGNYFLKGGFIPAPKINHG